MQNYVAKYKPFLLFLGKFFLTYMLLTFLYQLYLRSFDAATFEPDGFTTLVSKNVKSVLQFLDYDVSMELHGKEPSYRMFIGDDSVVRIVEGCNAVSVVILFVAFIVAFSGNLKKMLLFILGGILLIHILNLLRIVALIIGLIKFPEYEHVMHDIIFPLFIYGVVFGLWVIWINKYSKYAKKSVAK